MWSIVLLALLLIAPATIVLTHRLRPKHMGALLLAAIITGSTLAAPLTHAASAECVAHAAPDSSSGVQGVTQSFNVVSNDTPSDGATFVLSSLRLAFVGDSVAGSTLSSDEKTVTAPSEGEYEAKSTGSIEFAPQSTFVGNARGVAYQITDTAGETLSSTYKPIVIAPKQPPLARNDSLPSYCLLIHEPGLYDLYKDQSCSTAEENEFSVNILSNDRGSSINKNSVDLDLSVPGVQRTISTASYTAVFTPATGVLKVTITNAELYPPHATGYQVYDGQFYRTQNNSALLQYRFKDTAGRTSNIATVRHIGIYTFPIL